MKPYWYWKWFFILNNLVPSGVLVVNTHKLVLPKTQFITLWNHVLENRNHIDIHDYHNWYSTIDSGLIEESNAGFLWNGKDYEQFKPIGMFWNDSFCRSIGQEKNFGCYVEVGNLTNGDKSECNVSNCYFYHWKGQFQKIRLVFASFYVFFLKQITECDRQIVSKNLSLSTCPVKEEIKAPPTLRDLRIDIRKVLHFFYFQFSIGISKCPEYEKLLAKLI